MLDLVSGRVLPEEDLIHLKIENGKRVTVGSAILKVSHQLIP